jgi:hypothetical protein
MTILLPGFQNRRRMFTLIDTTYEARESLLYKDMSLLTDNEVTILYSAHFSEDSCSQLQKNITLRYVWFG